MNLRSALTLVILIFLSFLGNYYSLSLMFGADYLFGSIGVLLILYYYGLGWGLMAAVIVHGYTYFLWGHPYGFISFFSETLFVGILLSRWRHNLLIIDGIFWLLVGMPLNWVYYNIVLPIDSTTAWFIMFKQVVNGVCNTLLANIIICFLPLEKILRGRTYSRKISLQTALFNLFAAMVLFSTLLLTIRDVRQEMQYTEAEILNELQSLARDVQTQLSGWVQRGIRIIQGMAGLAAKTSLIPSAQLQHDLEILKLSSPDFLTLYVINSSGISVAVEPKDNEEGEPAHGLDFSSNPWFKEMQRREQPELTKIYAGSRNTSNPIILLTAPIKQDNIFLGFAAASLDLKRIRELIRSFSSHQNITLTLTDTQGQVIASTIPNLTPGQTWSKEKAGKVLPINASVYRWLPAGENIPSVTRWQQSFFVQENSLEPELPWKLIIETSAAPRQNNLYTTYLQGFSIMIIMGVVALMISQIISRRVAQPLEQLVKVTEDLPLNFLEAKKMDWPFSGIVEVQSLIVNFKKMIDALKQNL
jgi:hypothetical protein